MASRKIADISAMSRAKLRFFMDDANTYFCQNEN
jgi:hypothetical protein